MKFETDIDKLTENFRESVKGNFSADVRNEIFEALEIASQVHTGQVRDDGTPYLLHPLRIALYLISDLELRDIDAIIIALLHDSIEDSPEAEKIIISKSWGHRVIDDLNLLSRPKIKGKTKEEINKEVYYPRLIQASLICKLVKLADKLDNLLDAVNCPSVDKQKKTLKEANDFYFKLIEDVPQAFMEKLKSDYESAISNLERCIRKK